MKRDILLCIAVAVSVVASYAAFVWVPSEATMGDLYRKAGLSLDGLHSILNDLFVGWIRGHYLTIQF